MKNMNRMCALALFLIAPGLLWAEQGALPKRTNGFYVGVGGGLATIEMQAGEIKLDGEELATKLTLGYRMQRDFSRIGINLAVEGGYLDLGTVTQEVLGSSFDLSSDGLNLYIVSLFPILDRWDIFAKAGLVYSDTNLKVEGVPLDSQTGTDLAGGFGAAFNTGTALGFRLDVDGFNILDGAWAATISGIYQFK